MFHKSSKQANDLSKRDIGLAMQVFDLADEGRKQYLNYEDIKVAILALFGYTPSKEEVCQMLQSYGHSTAMESGLTREQFEKAILPKFAAVDEDEEIRNAFTAFDAKCRGFLTLDDTKQIFSKVCARLPEDRVELAFREIDRDGDGRVSYKDFDFMMKFNNFS